MTRPMRLLLPGCAIAALLTAPASAQTNEKPATEAPVSTVSGQFATKTTGTITPAHVVSFYTGDIADVRNRSLRIVLAEIPVDEARVRAAEDPSLELDAIEELKRTNTLTLTATGDAYLSLSATFHATNTYLFGDSVQNLTVEYTTQSATRLAGRLFSPKPVKGANGDSYTVDLRFDVSLPSAPGPGMPLPVGGGDPGAALMNLLAAIAKRDVGAIRAALGPDDRMFAAQRVAARGMSEAEALLEQARQVASLKNVKIRSGDVSGDTARLDVETGDRKKPTVIRVRMVRCGTAWLFTSSPMPRLPVRCEA